VGKVEELGDGDGPLLRSQPASRSVVSTPQRARRCLRCIESLQP
jgi:hypothetical protein